MKRTTKAHIVRLLVGSFIFIMLITSASALAEDDLRIFDSQTVFRHFAYTMDENHRLVSADPDRIIDEVFPTQVVENRTLKVTLLPSYGGRILSIIYKPTGHELLYQNPVGTPFAIGDKSFYYDWIMVYGGIFPTFPEPEHGKTWGLPWESRIVEQTHEKIAVEMRFTDLIKPIPNVTPWRFVNGESGLTCIATVTVYRNKSFVQLNLKLINNQKEPVKYEYWTCTTLSPGSEPGKTFCPANTEIIAPVDRVKLRDDSWPWMGQIEREIDLFSHTFEYKNLAFFENWRDMGIAYASPRMEKEWWGVINHANEEGILRIADNKRHTPGMKFWTWGYKQSIGDNPEKFHDQRRPYIELWAGHSREFFTRAEMGADQQKVWDEYYIATVGLPKITYANQHGAAYLHFTTDKISKRVGFDASLFTTHLNEPLKIQLTLVGKKNIPLLVRTFAPGIQTADKFHVELARNQIPTYACAYELKLTAADGELLMKTSIPFGIKDGISN